jgi:uncharacterized protein YcnI
MRARLFWCVSLSGVLAFAGAEAHVAVSPDTGAPGGELRIALDVEHGCSGAATTAIRVRLDDRIVVARPMAKPGWSVQVTHQKVTQPDGSAIDAPREIAWTGGSIPGDFYDEFVMLVQLPAGMPGSVVYFPVVQECGATTVRWIELPLAGEDPATLDFPAPSITLTDGTAPHASGKAD